MTDTIFTRTPMPYTTRERGDCLSKVVVHGVTPENMLICVKYPKDFGEPYAYLQNADGTDNHGLSDYDLVEPPLPGRDAYDAMPQHRKDVVEHYITRGQKIYGIKYLRGELDLGLGDAKRLFEQLDVDHANRLTNTRWHEFA